nr:hypothetical protein CFP56_02695 [Quercus suber]
MAALEIKNHFKGLRVQTARRRRDPFATGFEDDSSDDANAPRRRRRSRSDSDRSPHPSSTTPTTAAAPVAPPVIPPPKATSNEASPFHALDALQDSGDDDFVTAPPKRALGRTASPAPFPRPAASTRRRKSPEPSSTARRDRRAAAALAAGPLAYLDDSDDDWDDRNPRRSDNDDDDEDGPAAHRHRADQRGYSPAPRKHSDSLHPSARASTPRGNRASPTEHSQTRAQPPRHTVASAFAGTKYLQDSDSEEEAVSSRRNSAENGDEPDLNGTRADLEDLTPYESAFTAHRQKHLEVKRVDKPKQNGSGVSWRAFSAGRSEQRTAEIEALQARLQQRGRCISFGTHATTDDGNRVPVPSLGKFCSDGRGRTERRGKSPPRRHEDVQPGDDEIADETAVKIDELGGFRNEAFSGKRSPGEGVHEERTT